MTIYKRYGVFFTGQMDFFFFFLAFIPGKKHVNEYSLYDDDIVRVGY